MSYYPPPGSGVYGAPPGAPPGGPPGSSYGMPPPAGAPPAAAAPAFGMMPPQQQQQQQGAAAPGGGGWGAPQSAAPAYGTGMGMGMPPSSAAPAFGGNPMAPMSTNNAISSGSGGFAPPASAPRSNVAFFSPTGGTAVPAASLTPSKGPPPSSMGMMPPPPSSSAAFGAAPNSGGGGVQMMAAIPPPGAPGAVYGATPGVAAASGGFVPPMATMSAPIPNAHSMSGMPMGFDSGNNLASYQPQYAGMQGMGGVPGTPMDPAAAAAAAAAAAPASNAPPLPSLEEMDLSIQCNPAFLRASVGRIVNSQAAASQSRLPLGLVCKPMAGDVGTDNDEIEVVDFGATGIVRCKRCRTYINPFVSWADNGRRWRCNICGMLNDVPSTYFSHLDNNGQRRDKDQRPELSRCSVEFVAPGDYMVRPPQPPVYFFVIDVSEAAIASGMMQSLVAAVKRSLDELPGSCNSRTQIGFITFDSHIHFYNLKSSLAAPQMLVVSDVADIILPSPEDLLVNLQDSRAVVETLLDSLPSMFKSGDASPNSCTGPALLAAKRIIQHLGGKLLLFQSSLPTIGEGALKLRENPRLLGTDKEHSMLNAEDPWYKTNAIDFSRLQVCVDTFLFSGQYTDLATLAVLSKYTSGSTYYYPAYHAPRDGAKFECDLQRDLVRATAFEAVMRVRATRGLRFSNFYGNYFIRGTDLLALPNCTADSSFSLDIAYDEAQLTAQAITVQAALLYTSAAGERRIRVHTMVLPVTNSLAEMTESLDIDCAMNLLAKQAVDIAQKTGMDNARQRVNQTTIDIMRNARLASQPQQQMQQQQPYGMQPQQMMQQQMMQQQQAQPGAIPASLLLLPLYAMSLQKSPVIRGGTDVRIDERAFFQQLLNNMDIEESKVFIYPRLFSVHDMGDDIGLPCDNADDDVPTAGPLQVRLPSILNLSYERLSPNGIFLLENGQDMFMWVGRSVNPAIVSTLFGVPSLEGADMSMLRLQPDNSDFSSRVDAVVGALREDRARYMQLHFIREGDGYAEAYFARYLIEDRANFSGGLSYTEYHAHVTRAMTGMPG